MYRILSILSLAALAAIAACAAPPADLDLSLMRPTADGKFIVSLLPPARPVAINQLHSWQVRLASPAGVPIAHAHIEVGGGMPQHGHGLPTQPQVTQELADGTYVIEGMKFSMTGWWQIRLAIESPEGADKVTFNAVVADPTAHR